MWSSVSRIGIFLVAGATIVTAAIMVRADQRPEPATASSANVYTPGGSLAFPEHTDRWITLGASIGGNYDEGAFDPKNPGTIGVVQIEPDAYHALLDTGHYPNGTLLLLTFYEARSKSVPQLKGFVQGDVRSREIHVIDRTRFPADPPTLRRATAVSRAAYPFRESPR